MNFPREVEVDEDASTILCPAIYIHIHSWAEDP
jgi:hypothetical protein